MNKNNSLLPRKFAWLSGRLYSPIKSFIPQILLPLVNQSTEKKNAGEKRKLLPANKAKFEGFNELEVLTNFYIGGFFLCPHSNGRF